MERLTRENELEGMLEIVTQDRDHRGAMYDAMNVENARLQQALDAERHQVQFWKERAEAHEEDHLIINSLNELVASMKTQLAEQRMELDAEREKVAGLEAQAAYGEWCLTEHRKDMTDLDGGSLQDKAVELGLLVEVTVTEPCGEACRCAEYGVFPMQCLRRATRHAAEGVNHV